jgi:two-component system chemotaxis response regulator CheY
MSIKVLIIDDSSSVRRQLGNILSAEGFDIVEATDGLEGAREIRSNAQLAMVICDVNMPKLNGLDMLDSVAEEIARRALPVVMLTTEGEPHAMERAKRAGARGWIMKPFKEHLLVGAVKKLTAQFSKAPIG